MLRLRTTLSARAFSSVSFTGRYTQKSSLIKASSLITRLSPVSSAGNFLQSVQSQRPFSSSVVREWKSDYESRSGGFRNDRGYDNDRGFDSNRRYGNDRRSNSRGRGGNNRKGSGQSDFDSQRNTARNSGPEGDGLMGLENYERTRSLENVSLIELAKEDALKNQKLNEDGSVIEDSEEVVSTNDDFSKVKTQLLIDHKILSPVLANSLIHNRKYLSLTEVQSQTIIPVLRGESIVVRAKTGTGKTAAFSIPAIQHVLDAIQESKAENGEDKKASMGVKALIISPTRELAQQIADEISAITSYGPMREILTVCFVGGISKGSQIRHAFRGRKPADIVVATPGRLYDVLQEPGIAPFFANVKIKVLDEADRLLDIGFSDQLADIDEVLNSISNSGKFQTMLFSATIDRRVKEFAKRELGAGGKLVDTVPENEPEAHTLVDQSVLICNSWKDIYPATYHEISKSLKEVLASNAEGEKKIFKGIIFLPTVPSVDHYAQVLRVAFKTDENIPAGSRPRVLTIHGKMTQGARQRASDDFRKRNEPTILITTDVVARGMDFPNVSHVFQMGTARDAASYVHRIGRTGRIGHSGKASLIMTKFEQPYLKDLERKNINLKNIRHFAKFSEDNAEAVADVERLEKAIEFVDLSPEELVDIANSIVTSYSYMRRGYRVDGLAYLDANAQFPQHLFKMPDFKWAPRIIQSWGAYENRRSGGRGGSGFGGRGGSSGYGGRGGSSFGGRGSKGGNRDKGYGNFDKRDRFD